LATLRSCEKQFPVQLELEEEKMSCPEPILIDHAGAVLYLAQSSMLLKSKL